MIDEIVLKDALLALVERSKAQYLMLTSLQNELAALRETVRGLDPTFPDVLEGKRKDEAESTRPFVSLELGLIGDLIQRLTNNVFR